MAEIRFDETKLKAAMVSALVENVDKEVVDEAIKKAVRSVLNDRFDWNNTGSKLLAELADSVVRQYVKELLKEEVKANDKKLREFVKAAFMAAVNKAFDKNTGYAKKIRESVHSHIWDDFDRM